MKKNGYKKNFIVTLNEIIENLNVNNSFYISKIKKALILLSKTNYTFKNSLYSNEVKGILDKEIISTIILNINRPKSKIAGDCFIIKSTIYQISKSLFRHLINKF